MAQVDLFGNRKAVNNESVIASPAAKALSVCQPFAALIVAGWKSIELRSWNTKMRGTFLIHAAKKVRTADVKRLGTMGDAPDGHSWVTGAIIGVAELYDVRHYDSVKDVDKDAKAHCAGLGASAEYGFMLRGSKRFRTPVPCLGNLGFFDVPFDLEGAGY